MCVCVHAVFPRFNKPGWIDRAFGMDCCRVFGVNVCVVMGINEVCFRKFIILFFAKVKYLILFLA